MRARYGTALPINFRRPVLQSSNHVGHLHLHKVVQSLLKFKMDDDHAGKGPKAMTTLKQKCAPIHDEGCELLVIYKGHWGFRPKVEKISKKVPGAFVGPPNLQSQLHSQEC